jgi:tetratricopeptide (TPR) repeat protein
VNALCAQGDAEDPPEDPAEWFAQAEGYAEQSRRLDLAVRVGTVALGFGGGDTAPRRLALAGWRNRLEGARHAAEAVTLSGKGDHAAALAAHERALDLDPASAEGLLGKARALLALERAAECREWLDGFAGRSDCEPERTYLAGMAADAAGDGVAAHDFFDRVKDHTRLPAGSRAHASARAGELSGEPRVRLARIEGLPDLETAVSAYAAFCSDYPGHAEAWRERGVGLAMLDRADEALECLRRAAALEPGEPKSYDHEAVVLARLKRFDEAIAALDRGLRACPASGTLNARKGVFLAMAGRDEEALRACDAALAADPAYAETWAFKGDVEQKLGRTTEAIASLERYLAAKPGSREKRVQVARRQLWGLQNPGRELDPERARACEGRAIQQGMAGALPEALSLLDEAVAADPFLDTAWFNRATCLFQMSRFEEALASLARAEDLAGPTSQLADATAACCRRLGRGEAAIAAYDRLLARLPASPEGLRGKARTLAGLGRPADAWPLYQRLVARSPGDAELLQERAGVLRALGR